MSSPTEALTSGLPVTNQALEPAWVRKGSAAVQKEYAIGQEFEQMLVQQLAKSMTETTGLSGEGSGEEGEEGGQAGNGVLSSMLPQALASGVANDGGLGLAAELTRQLQGVSGASGEGSLNSAQGTDAAGMGTAGTGTTGTGPAAGVEGSGTTEKPAMTPAGGVQAQSESGGTA